MLKNTKKICYYTILFFVFTYVLAPDTFNDNNKEEIVFNQSNHNNN